MDDKLLQNIAMENNLSETAFFVRNRTSYELRWFTPASEVALCGHATLAAAHVIFFELADDVNEIIFKTKSGDLIVKRDNDYLVMDFPVIESELIQSDASFSWLNSLEPLEILGSKQDLMVVFKSEQDVLNYKPDTENIRKLKYRGMVVTARAKEYDFVSRAFYPALSVEEDPVTGSAHCQTVIETNRNYQMCCC